jgi:fructose-bisphosphate aldolase class II
MVTTIAFDAKPYDRISLQGAFSRSEIDWRFIEHRLSAQTALSAQGGQAIRIFVNDHADRVCLEILQSLGIKHLAIRCAGFNGVDLKAAVELGFQVTRVPAYSPYAVAEHAVGLLLALNRKIPRASNRVRDLNFSLQGLGGFDLHGKTAGIFGTGKIGRVTAQILRGFGMKVLAYDPFPSPEWASKHGIEYTDSQTLARECEVISLHTPLTPETHHIIRRATIELMKPGTILINVSRGALIETGALIEALKSGWLGGVGLDVYEEEEGGLAESKADGIVQVSTRGGAFASGSALKDMALGAISIAEHVHRAAERYPIYVALHTDHCLKDRLDKFVIPVVEETEKRRAAGRPNLFTGHMFDGSNLSLGENLEIAEKLLERSAKNDLLLEIETGAVGGEEDDVVSDHAARLYTTPEDTLEVARRLNPIGGRYLLAATFGNMHGAYKPGHVKLRPKVLKECQDAVVKAHGEKARFHLFFHGGSGSTQEEIHESLHYGVVKMNVDTDMQYAFTRPAAGYMFGNFDGVLKIDGEVGNKKAYDRRSYLALAETVMAERVKQAASDPRGAGKSMFVS